MPREVKEEQHPKSYWGGGERRAGIGGGSEPGTSRGGMVGWVTWGDLCILQYSVHGKRERWTPTSLGMSTARGSTRGGEPNQESQWALMQGKGGRKKTSSNGGKSKKHEEEGAHYLCKVNNRTPPLKKIKRNRSNRAGGTGGGWGTN